MYNLKQSALAILTFTSSAAFAGTMGPVCIEENATIPCAQSFWDVGLQALYIHPSTGLRLNTTSLPVTYPGRGEDIPSRIQPSWGWGFKLDGAYHYSTGSDININWYNYTNSVKTLKPLHDRLDNDGPIIQTIGQVNTQLKTQWDAVNAELGQIVHLGKRTKIRFHGGAQYSYIDLQYSDHPIYNVGFRQIPQGFANSKYYGFGPRAGADMSYGLGHRLEIYLNGAGALLVGPSNSDSGGGTHTSSKSVLIVPTLEGKLGAKWTPVLWHDHINIDAGYLWQTYLNAGLPSATNGNFFINGVYIGLKWRGSK